MPSCAAGWSGASLKSASRALRTLTQWHSCKTGRNEMIEVLRDWRAIGEAYVNLAREGLPRHDTPEKAWDLYNLYRLLRTVPRESRIIDLGCGGLAALRLADAMGFRNLYGVDLAIPFRDRLAQAARMWKRKTARSPFILKRMDITKLSFEDEAFDVAVSISTIEHGVDIRSFFREVSRVLSRDGRLFITTDYWAERTDIDASLRIYGRPWRIFDRADVEEMVQIAAEKGLVPLDPRQACFECEDRCVVWNGTSYTFIRLAFRKTG